MKIKFLKPFRRYKVMVVIIILLAVIGLAFLIDTAVQLIKDDSHKVAKCESVGGSWDGGCWYAGKRVNVDALLKDLYGEQ